jgi:hypothetical protein
MGKIVEKYKKIQRHTAVIENETIRCAEKRSVNKTQSAITSDFIDNYFLLDSSNVVYLSAQKLIKNNDQIENIFRHVVQKEALNNISELDTYMRKLNFSMTDAGVYICQLSAAGVSDWNRLSILGVRDKMTSDKNCKHRFSFAEWLGRFFFYGFEIIEYRTQDSLITFAMMKTGSPKKDVLPSRGWLFRMERIGFKGETMGVYKIRTMYPFSEYLQAYVVKLNGYNEAGKPADDFRVTPIGRFFRKFWLDELPQLYNVLKGEMNLIGVRPLSRTRFNELPEQVQKERIKYKPGCIPPYVALRMPDSNGNIEAELIYLNDKRKAPRLTDIRYFFKAIFNIFTFRIVSA